MSKIIIPTIISIDHREHVYRDKNHIEGLNIRSLLFKNRFMYSVDVTGTNRMYMFHNSFSFRSSYGFVLKIHVSVWGDTIIIERKPTVSFYYTLQIEKGFGTDYDSEILLSSDEEAKLLFMDMIVEEYRHVYMSIKLKIK